MLCCSHAHSHRCLLLHRFGLSDPIAMKSSVTIGHVKLSLSARFVLNVDPTGSVGSKGKASRVRAQLPAPLQMAPTIAPAPPPLPLQSPIQPPSARTWSPTRSVPMREGTPAAHHMSSGTWCVSPPSPQSPGPTVIPISSLLRPHTSPSATTTQMSMSMMSQPPQLARSSPGLSSPVTPRASRRLADHMKAMRL